MSRRLIANFVISALAAFTPCWAQDTPSTQDRSIGWQADIDFLRSAIRRDHYLYKSQPLPKEFDRLAQDLLGRIDQMSDVRMISEMQRLMVTLGDGHCTVMPSERFFGRLKTPPEELPLRLHRFADGLFVIEASPGYENWIGRRITRIGPLESDQLMARVADYIPKDNQHAVRWFGPTFLTLRGPLESMGCVAPAATSVDIECVDRDGRSLRDEVKFVPFQMVMRPKLLPSRLATGGEPPLHLRRIGENFWFDTVADGHAVYCQFNQVADAPGETLAEFSARLERSLKQPRPRLLVIDVRYNQGGNADLLPPLVQTLKKFEQQPPGNIVVLIGPATFSAAQIFASILDHDTQAVFAGEPSGSRPNFVGEENPVELPWSGLVVNISNRYHEIIPGDSREYITPDLPIEMTSTDYFRNVDPVLDGVLRRYSTSK